jgi:hypothetical protein
MKKTAFSLILVFSVLSLNAQTISQHGLVLNGGLGRVGTKSNELGVRWDEIDYKVGLALGYRFRFNKPMPKSFHYDLDANFGVKGARVCHWEKIEWTDEDGNTYSPAYGGYVGWSGGAGYHYTSIGFTANYSLIKNLSVGLGVEPAFFLKANYQDELKNRFNVPVVAKIAYNLKYVEVGISGKYGLVNVFEMEYMKPSKIREIQLSLFIPFKAR